jgi:hypothetical protein
MNPFEAVSTGADEAICGQCALRGESGKKRACYVTIAHAPSAIYRNLDKRQPLDFSLIRNRDVRLGAYGDPAFISLSKLHQLVKVARSHTGYTHQWRSCDPDYRLLLMASVENEEDYHIAREAGWRTFRVRHKDQPLLKGEAMCPASEEAGKKLQCITCGRCNGASNKKSISIIAHGMGARYL